MNLILSGHESGLYRVNDNSALCCTVLLNSLGFVDILYSKPELSILGSRSNLAGILFV